MRRDKQKKNTTWIRRTDIGLIFKTLLFNRSMIYKITSPYDNLQYKLRKNCTFTDCLSLLFKEEYILCYMRVVKGAPSLEMVEEDRWESVTSLCSSPLGSIPRITCCLISIFSSFGDTGLRTCPSKLSITCVPPPPPPNPRMLLPPPNTAVSDRRWYNRQLSFLRHFIRLL